MVSNELVEQTHTRLCELAEWEHTLRLLLSTIRGLSAAPMTLAPSASQAQDASPIERAIDRANTHIVILSQLQQLGVEWSWRGNNVDGPVTRWMLTKFEWAHSSGLVNGWAISVIEKTHNAALAGAKHYMNRICPRHPETATLLEQRSDGSGFCHECGQVASIDDIDAQALAQLVDANPLVELSVAAELLAIPRKTIRQWARRKAIEATATLEVYLGEVYDYAREHSCEYLRVAL